jgi:hypothetical protein
LPPDYQSFYDYNLNAPFAKTLDNIIKRKKIKAIIAGYPLDFNNKEVGFD